MDVTRSGIEGDKPRYCIFKATVGEATVQISCIENPNGSWMLLTPIGKPGRLGKLRSVADLEACETWVRWIAAQVFTERRPLSVVLDDVKHSESKAT